MVSFNEREFLKMTMISNNKSIAIQLFINKLIYSWPLLNSLPS